MSILAEFWLELTSRPVRVENSSDSDVDTVLPLETIGQRLGHTFSFVIAGPRSDRVYMAPAGLKVKKYSSIKGYGN